MSNIKNIIISILLSLIVLSCFVFVYLHNGIHISNKDRFTDYKWREYQYKSNLVEGISYLNMDVNGFNNIKVPNKVDILIMGSSHMDACNVNKKYNLASILSEKYNNLGVYNIGILGHTIYRCGNNIHNAIDYFKPKMIVIEIDRVDLDIKSMEEVINKKASPIPSYDSGIIYYIQKYIPCSVNLFNQLNNWREVSNNNLFSITNEEEKKKDKIEITNDYKNKLFEFLNFTSNKNIKLVIIYQPITKINTDGSYKSTKNDIYSKVFKEECDKLNIEFIDLSIPFENLYYKEHKLPHGFNNTSLGKGHLNKYGHKIFAEELEKVIDNYVFE